MTNHSIKVSAHEDGGSKLLLNVSKYQTIRRHIP